MRKAKIICTIGPASNKKDILRQLILNGMDVTRINFSYGTLNEKARDIKSVKQISSELGKDITIIQDLCGPKIRAGEVEGGEIVIKSGQKVVLSPGHSVSNSQKIYIKYPYLIQDVHKNDTVLFDDGRMKFVVTKKDSDRIICEVITGGKLKSNKGINFPSSSLRVSALTSKDIQDVKFGIANGVDFIALSFVRKASDILKLRKIIKNRNKDIPIIAKIEKNEAVENIDTILDVSDGVMVARGDLGIEVPLENVPIYQKMIIKKANHLGKPVITATQMLESMVENPIPTRAEATDISNAILDGTDAVMLSEETAVGKYPVEAVKIMALIAEKTEQIIDYSVHSFETEKKSIADAVAHGTYHMARDLDASAIITFTSSGFTAKKISKYRPKAPIYAFTPNKKVIRVVNLYYGVSCFLAKEVKTTDAMFKEAFQTALDKKIIKKGDLVILTAGVPVREKANTNLIRVVKIN